MAQKILITGSADGLGLMTAKRLLSTTTTTTTTTPRPKIYLHARSAARANDARTACPEATDVLVADLSSPTQTRALAEQIKSTGLRFDAVIHNAGLYQSHHGEVGPDGVPSLFAVNTLAPYMLTVLLMGDERVRPGRVVFLSSSMHEGGRVGRRGGEGGGDGLENEIVNATYGDTKLHNTMMAVGFARRFGGLSSSTATATSTAATEYERTTFNSLDPGWVPTKMGGSSAPDDIEKAIDTYVMLATGEAPAKGETGQHWYQSAKKSFKADARDEALQDELFDVLGQISGIKLPSS